MLDDAQMSQDAANGLGKKQKIVLSYVYPNSRAIQLIPSIKTLILGLVSRGLLQVSGDRVALTSAGKIVVETNSLYLPNSTPDSLDDLLKLLRSPSKTKTNNVQPRKLGRRQKILLESVCSSPVKIKSEHLTNSVISNLKLKGLIEVSDNQMSIAELGRVALLSSGSMNLDEQQGTNESSLSPPSDTASLFDVVPRKLGKRQAMFLQFFDNAPRSLKQTCKKNLIPPLQERGLIEINRDVVSITPLGKSLLASFQQEAGKVFDKEELQSLFVSSQKIQSQKRLHKKSEEFLSLYKQGLVYQAIGDLHGMTRERVRQILNKNPAFHDYLKEYEEQKVIAEQEKAALAKQILLSKSIAALYPERIAELWDYEKNGDLNPESIPANSTLYSIWLRCPIDGHSWKKKVNDITNSWARNETSGCPVCAGRTGERKKQTTLAEAYIEFVVDYWDFEKNASLGLDPEILTLGSNRKAWFKCSRDGNEWESSIGSTINQQWALGNAGCKVCNGTDKRKIGKWGEANPIAVEFPDEVAKYWLYEKNNELKLDPSKIKIGSSKEAWFKCPVDGLEWKAKISAISNSSWKRGSSGCPACRGLVTTNSTSLLALYPEFVGKLWDYEKNSETDLDPNNLTRASSRSAWFRCPIDGYEWEIKIKQIVAGSWKVGNNGCPRCGMGWTLKVIRQFVATLQEHIPNLTQAERYKIFEQAGALGTQSSEGLKIVKDIIKGRLSGQKLKEIIQGKKVQASGSQENAPSVLDANAELTIAEPALSLPSSVSGTPQNNAENLEHDNTGSELPRVRVHKSLEFLSSKVVASADQEAVDFFVASRRNRIWAEIFEDESAAEGVKSFTDEGYGRQVRDQFLDEYNQARDLPIPAGWTFRVDGKITAPNLMQKLAAVRLRSQKRMLNLSLTGTGKTIGGILGSRTINARLTVIICPLDTIPNWNGEIKHVFPDSKVTTKDFNPYWQDVESGHHYIILNHEMFQQPSSSHDIRQLVDRYKIDLIVVDEIHRCKQRSDDPSKRRQMVLALITNAAERNPDLHVLGMSATPVINNLKEGKSLVELVTGVEHSDLGEKATLNNCMRLHQALVTIGIRSRVKPKININRVSIPIDCTHLVNELRENGTSILKMEQILTRARIPAILKELCPKTIIYTHYIEGIVEQLKDAIEAKGWTVGFHLGGDKSGRNSFIDGSTDILIASSAMAVGVDGFQRVCNRLILNIPPWTSAELEQLEGRINRQGQTHKHLTIITPTTYGFDDGERWSWDEGRLARLQNKQTIADAAVDGVMPEAQLRTEAQAFRDLRGWLDRLRLGEQRPVTRCKIFVPLPETDPTDTQRRQVRYGDFSRINARWNSSYSKTTYQRLQKNPEEWMQYHTLYQEARKTWEVVPYQEAIKWLQKRSGLAVGDFGCGEALIAKELANKHTFYNLDFIAIDASVTECDMAHVPLEDSCLDVAMFSLSLMGLNIADYVREATRTLKLDGQLWIYEVESRIADLTSFIHELEVAGFKVIENFRNWKFRFIRAIKSETK